MLTVIVMVMVTIVLGPISSMHGRRTTDVAAPLADMLQFKGPAIFLAP